MRLASPEDIAAMKVVAITQRGTAKDFFDMNVVDADIWNVIGLFDITGSEKYGVSEDYSYQTKRSLVYFDDAVRAWVM